MPIIKSIYWNQNPDGALVYLFPFQDVTLGSVLTVNDSQEAYFYKNGSLCDKLGQVVTCFPRRISLSLTE